MQASLLTKDPDDEAFLIEAISKLISLPQKGRTQLELEMAVKHCAFDESEKERTDI